MKKKNLEKDPYMKLKSSTFFKKKDKFQWPNSMDQRFSIIFFLK